MTITEVPQRAAPDTPVSRPPTAVSDAPPTVSGAASNVSRTQKRNAIKPAHDRLMTVLSVAAAIGGPLIGAIGFAMSYSTLAKKALTWGFSADLAPWFPVGVDASIIVFLALDLYLIRKDTPWPLLRMAAHGMTFATIWFNASSQGHIAGDPVRAASHGVMPLLFVIGVEAARRLFIKKTQLEAGTAADRIPLHRWILAPVATPRFYRRMRLHGIRSYPEMIRRQQDLTAYEQWLKRKHGDLSKASEDELLPMTMAAHGYTVAQALALPEQQEREAEARAEEAERRRLDAQTRRELAQKQAEARRLEADGELETVRARVEGTTAQARAHARAQASAAERAAELEEQALETAVIAEARAREAAAERQASQEREAKAAADARAAELERQAAEKRKLAAEADRVAVAEAQAVETVEIAEARQRAAEADRAAAETERAAAETRRRATEAERLAAQETERRAVADANTQAARRREAETELAAAETRLAAAEIERRAVEIEDAAKLTPRQRAVRKVARMILAVDGMADRLPLAEIQRELVVTSPGTASEYRQEAAELVAGGYRP
ncbi:hypothetical protein AQJ43_37230 [Streptomyces avermitilis]|uniref:DUF2637 domain-containing protein n=3 Tax=Streptomyces avermitilis TaxID=33903 RepID=Q825D3_STRAW|nr:DUF2637 domain-containing protein [Streptomyces avermitilis]MYT03060.1 DUF2637 domain-containing protein [Streptomyces sp. SID5469]KUN47267.1 hypothetical protein AQJ43_37230 [Streptomyces avermitilis]BAC75236.1 hypothetical protein SAVERM_7525 [Streptomyces avermitilis MA-4680 = NBRC 14893]BAU77650.1 hypothetical protein SAVERM_2p207 [Streptomyces avermitilis MA-4680 = NBRC 14893]GDY80629.1 hypothetical protein SAV31267_101140 [Streptomyces avermitilis]